MRNRSASGVLLGAFALTASALFLSLTQPLAAQGARRTGGGAGADDCVSPLPMPMMGGPTGGRGGRGRGAPPDSTTQSDSSARRRAPRARGCPPFFPDSLALSAAQKQQIVSLRATFAQSHATEFAQLRAILDSED